MINQLREDGLIDINNTRVGEKYLTNEGLWLEIIEYVNNRNCTIKFNDGYIEKNRQYVDIIKGQIKNPMYPSIYNKGFIGIGKFKVWENNKNTKVYDTWRSMFERSYSKNLHKKHPTYIGCSVVDEWYNFQNFGKWFDENYNSEIMQHWHLDKDILVKGNKIYSPDTCCFIPQELNTILLDNKINRGNLPIGVTKSKNKFIVRLKKYRSKVYLGTFINSIEAFETYKIAKESHVREVSEKWKSYISLKVYNKLIQYKTNMFD